MHDNRRQERPLRTRRGPAPLAMAAASVALWTVFGVASAAHGLPPRTAVILAVNDVYRIEGLNYDYGPAGRADAGSTGGSGGLARVRTLRDVLDKLQRQLDADLLARIAVPTPDQPLDAREQARRERLRVGLGDPATSRSLLLHAGDFLFPSLLSEMSWNDSGTVGCSDRPPKTEDPPKPGEKPRIQGRQMIRVMNCLTSQPAAKKTAAKKPNGKPLADNDPDDRTIVVFGNHEFDKTPCGTGGYSLRRNIETSRFLWLHSNIEFADCFGRPQDMETWLKDEVLVTVGGIKIGLFGLTTDMQWPDYVRGFAGVLPTALRRTESLRKQAADVVVALTHLPVDVDKKILETLRETGPDLIVGGHDHERMAPAVTWQRATRRSDEGLVAESQQTERRRVYKADADAKTASVITLRVEDDPRAPHNSRVTVQHDVVELNDRTAPPDSKVQAAVADELTRHEQRFCAGLLRKSLLRKDEVATDCLKQELGTIRGAALVGDETKLRREETSLGNWLTDVMRRECNAAVAFIGSGSLRLNLDLPDGAIVRRRHLEELFIFKAKLRRVTLTGDRLRAAIAHAVQEWPGSGHWLQVSGLAFRHAHDDSATDAARRDRIADLTLLAPSDNRPLQDTDSVVVVTSDYIASGRDGFGMVKDAGAVENCEADGPNGKPTDDLQEIVERILRKDSPVMVSGPEGRICQGGSRCQAIGGDAKTMSRRTSRRTLAIAGLGAIVLLVLASWTVWSALAEADGDAPSPDAQSPTGSGR